MSDFVQPYRFGDLEDSEQKDAYRKVYASNLRNERIVTAFMNALSAYPQSDHG